MRVHDLCLILAGMVLAPGGAALGAVTGWDVLSVTPVPGSAGRFGSFLGARKITVRATLELDPGDAHDQSIVDIAQADRGADGKVHADTDVVMLVPDNPNGTVVVELPNRGTSQAFSLLSDLQLQEGKDLHSAGNGFFLARGYTLLLVGWQGDITSAQGMGIRLPVAHGVTGRTRDQWLLQDPTPTYRVNLSWPIGTADSAHVYVRTSADAPVDTLPGMSFRFIDSRTVEIDRPAPAFSGLYELWYQARDPAVMGIGFAAVRDVVSYLRNTPASSNPLAGRGRLPARFLATGISQTGRVLRDFLYQGFNSDEQGRQVFDGLLPIIPGTRRSFTNARFAQPGRNPATESDQYYPVDQFPFTYETLTDSLTGRTDGLLLRCRANNTCPRIMEFDSEYEMWGSRGSLLVTDTHGKPVALPDNVRAYMLAGSPHMNTWGTKPERSSRCVLATSPVAAGPVLRALLVALDRWVKDGAQPPPSQYPSVSDGTLVPAAQVYAPGIPLPYKGQHMRALLILQTDSGPLIKGEYPVLLPKAGKTGNAIAGIHLPPVAVPRASYTGWNPQTARSGPEDLCDHAGGMLQLAADRQQRLATHDSRPSLKELYPSQAAYQASVQRVAKKLADDRFLLPEDIAPVVGSTLELQTSTDSRR